MSVKLKTLRGFVKDLKKIYEKHQQIKDFGFGFIEDVTFKNNNDGTTLYPYLFVIPDVSNVFQNQNQLVYHPKFSYLRPNQQSFLYSLSQQ